MVRPSDKVTVIYPGVGTIVEAFATKDLNRTYLAIYVPGDVVLIELPAKKETRAVEFALKDFRAVG